MILSERFMRKYLTPLILFLFSFGLYVATLAPTVVTIFDDSLEMQLAVPTLSILHPTGYPLYELLAWLLTRLVPLGDAAYRVNLFSALAAASAVMLLYLVARRLGVAQFPALVAALLLAFSPVWHSQATIAEVYALQGAIMLFILYAFLRWGKEKDLTQSRQGAKGQDEKWLMLGALGVGMGMAHHRLTFLLLPGLLVYIFWVDRSLFLRPHRWLKPLIVLALPLLSYALLPLRAHVGSLDGSYARIGFWGWLAGGGYGSAFITGNPFDIHRTPLALLDLARGQFGWLGIATALISLPWWKKHPKKATLLLLIALADFAFAAIYKVQDIEVFLIPLFIVMALWIALGLDVVWQGVRGLLPETDVENRKLMRLGLVAVALLLLTWPAVTLAANWPEQNRSAPPARAWGVHDYGLDLLQSAGPEGRVIGLLGEMTLMRYFQYDRQMGLGVQTLAADRDEDRMAGIEASLADGMPTYTTHPLDGLPARHALSASGPLIRVWPGSPQLPPPAHLLNEQLLPGVTLTGWQTIWRQPRSGPSLRVLLWWRADETLDDFKISARLLNPGGSLIMQQDAWPVHNAYPPAFWRAGETVLDSYDLALPTLPDAETTLLIILYNPADGAEFARWQTMLPPKR